MVFPFMREILPVVFFVVENLRVDNQTGQLHCTEHTIDNLYSTKTEVSPQCHCQCPCPTCLRRLWWSKYWLSCKSCSILRMNTSDARVLSSFCSWRMNLNCCSPSGMYSTFLNCGFSIQRHQSAPISINQCQSASININQKQVALIIINQHQKAPISINQHQSASISSNQNQSVSIRVNQNQSASININQHQSV